MPSSRGPGPLLACLVATLALAAPAPAAEVERIELEGPVAGGLALTSDTLAWAEKRIGAVEVLARRGGVTQRLESYGGDVAVGAVSAEGSRVAVGVAERDQDGYVASYVDLLRDGGTTRLRDCGAERAAPDVALGAGTTVLRCAAERLPRRATDVRVDGAVVGQGSAVSAAGPFVAWLETGQRAAVYDTRSASLVARVPGVAAFAVESNGWLDAISVELPPPPMVVLRYREIRRTPLGGTPNQIVATDAVGRFGRIAADGGLIVYSTARGGQYLHTVILPDGTEHLLAETAPGTGEVATDGTRVAINASVPGCGVGRILVVDTTTIVPGEPVLNESVGRCPAHVDGPLAPPTARGGELKLYVECKVIVVDADVCSGQVRVTHRGRTLAAGTFDVGGYGAARLPLTAAGRAALAGRDRLRARFELIREGPTSTMVNVERETIRVRR